MNRKLMFIFIIFLQLSYSSEKLLVNGKILDTFGSGIENVRIISSDSSIAYTDINGEYEIEISKDYVPVDESNFEIIKYKNYTITIFNILGQKVFYRHYQYSNYSNFAWNGYNNNGIFVSSGIYFCILEIGNRIVTKRKISIIDHRIYNNRPFSNYVKIEKKSTILSKQSDYAYDTFFNLEGENFKNITNLKVKIDYDGNNDKKAFAEDIILSTYEIDYIQDIDGNIYKTVKIGDQWWMAENLKVKRFKNGDSITQVTNNSRQWKCLGDSMISLYSDFNNYNNASELYGYHYNWYAINDTRKIAPEGWHVSTDEDWKSLEQYLGMNNTEVNNIGWRGTDEGDKLKSSSDWESYFTNEDTFCFSAYPAGYCDTTGTLLYKHMVASFWSPSLNDETDVNSRHLGFLESNILRGFSNKLYGFTVRCVKDFDSTDIK